MHDEDDVDVLLPPSASPWFLRDFLASQAVPGQQVSLAAARTFAGRMVRRHGAPVAGGAISFPTAHRLAGTDLVRLQQDVRITTRR